MIVSVLFQQIRGRAQFSYEVLKLETDAAANMLYINGRLTHRTREEINENSMSVSKCQGNIFIKIMGISGYYV